MRFGIIKERKNPPDRRVVLSPKACLKVVQTHLGAEIIIESSTVRVFSDKAYQEVGLNVTDQMENCDILLGVKEVPVDALIPNKKYFFFSHTIKKQPHNRKLLQAVLKKNIELYDHELITNTQGHRLVAFGRYAGIVGAYNGFRTYGLKFNRFQLPKASTLSGQKELIIQLQKIELPPFKILLTGRGRVGSGAKEILDAMGIKCVDASEYLEHSFEEAVYCQIDVMDYNIPKDGTPGETNDFFQNPQKYKSNFFRFAKVTDLYFAGHFYGDGAPYLYTKEDVKHPDFRIKVVADISCDVGGPVATTIRSSTIAEPIYGYDPKTEAETDYKNPNAIAVMAVDNLPCEIPLDSSTAFGDAFVEYVIPAFFNDDQDGILERALMTKNGKLTERYAYLQVYVNGV